MHKEFLVEVWEGGTEKLVEDVVVTLSRLLAGNSRLLQQVELNVSSSNLSGGTKVNSDKLSL